MANYMFGITSFGSQICMTPCKHTIKNLCDVLVQKLPTLLTQRLFKDCPACMDCLYMHCSSNLHTNNYHMASDKMNEKAKRTSKTSSKLLAVQAVTLPSWKEPLFFLLINYIFKKCYKTLFTVIFWIYCPWKEDGFNYSCCTDSTPHSNLTR
jgi:hypothetical protein